MRGFVPTPEKIVDFMVGKLFADRPPTTLSTLLDPGCGPGAFIGGVLRWCKKHDLDAPQIVGYENSPSRYAEAQANYGLLPSVTLRLEDFLEGRTAGSFDYVIGNPPYVPITAISVSEKAQFRKRFLSARGRFDLYLLFFEQALRMLAPLGRLVFITPEKFLYVKTAEPFRRLLRNYQIKEIELVSEQTFGKLVTYPTITTIEKVAGREKTVVVLRSSDRRAIRFPQDGSSVQPRLYENGKTVANSGVVLADICIRVSCGVATGLDSFFVKKTASLDRNLLPFALPAISGRDLHTNGDETLKSDKSMLAPYDESGRLLPLPALGDFGRLLLQPENRRILQARTCAERKPWHAFHDSFPLPDMLRPKLLCKDITAEPRFWADSEGSLIPCHSVYYVVPRDPSLLYKLRDYLNGREAGEWLRAHCHRAANDFLRLQSAILKRLPIPRSFIGKGMNPKL